MIVLRTVLEKIISEFYEPEARIAVILKKYGVSSEAFHNSLEIADLMGKYELAQQTKAEMLAEEVIEISDSDLDPMRARNRMDSRKWYASKMKPNKFGEKIQMDITTNVDLSNALLEAKARSKQIEEHIPEAEYKLIEDKKTGLIEDEAEKLLVEDMLK